MTEPTTRIAPAPEGDDPRVYQWDGWVVRMRHPFGSREFGEFVARPCGCERCRRFDNLRYEIRNRVPRYRLHSTESGYMIHRCIRGGELSGLEIHTGY